MPSKKTVRDPIAKLTEGLSWRAQSVSNAIEFINSCFFVS